MSLRECDLEELALRIFGSVRKLKAMTVLLSRKTENSFFVSDTEVYDVRMGQAAILYELATDIHKTANEIRNRREIKSSRRPFHQHLRCFCNVLR